MAPGRSVRVLVVDDDPTMRDVLRTMLSLQGCEVLTVSNGEASASIADELSPDVVVVDFNPGTNGAELCRRLKERSAPPKVVVLAGGNSPDYLRGLAAGADACIAKPFSPLRLIRIVSGDDASEVSE